MDWMLPIVQPIRMPVPVHDFFEPTFTCLRLAIISRQLTMGAQWQNIIY